MPAVLLGDVDRVEVGGDAARRRRLVGELGRSRPPRRRAARSCRRRARGPWPAASRAPRSGGTAALRTPALRTPSPQLPSRGGAAGTPAGRPNPTAVEHRSIPAEGPLRLGCGRLAGMPDDVIRRLRDETAVWAVVGLSQNRARAAYGVAAFLIGEGKQVVPVHPRAETVHGQRGYASLRDIPHPVDVVDVFVRSAPGGPGGRRRDRDRRAGGLAAARRHRRGRRRPSPRRRPRRRHGPLPRHRLPPPLPNRLRRNPRSAV